mmetsp:Transcript_98534/g.256772  ORF Transcript_98534/g.256772 Transcript_98534/m.256772 type:complete len:207 (+) Transcript_98534:76-696(+)
MAARLWQCGHCIALAYTRLLASVFNGCTAVVVKTLHRFGLPSATRQPPSPAVLLALWRPPSRRTSPRRRCQPGECQPARRRTSGCAAALWPAGHRTAGHRQRLRCVADTAAVARWPSHLPRQRRPPCWPPLGRVGRSAPAVIATLSAPCLRLSRTRLARRARSAGTPRGAPAAARRGAAPAGQAHRRAPPRTPGPAPARAAGAGPP